MSGLIYLSGGGTAIQTKLIDQDFAEKIRGRSYRTCLYISAAMDGSAQDKAKEWFMDTYGSLFEIVDIAEDLLTFVKKDMLYDVIYIGGGDTGKLLDQFYSSKYDQILKKHVNEDKIIYGGSAGALIMGSTILTAPQNELSQRSNLGFNMIAENSVFVHFNYSTDHFKVAELTTTLNTPIIALAEDAGILFNCHTQIIDPLGSTVYRYLVNGQVEKIKPAIT